ncbi:MAG: hypothetical protein ABIL09_13215 [Gemmatimonadota bacterium]
MPADLGRASLLQSRGTVRPIHLQDLLSKAPLASREQQIQLASADLAQRQVAGALNQQHVLDASRARPATAPDAADHRVDDREESRGGRGRQNQGQREAEGETPAPDAGERHRAAGESDHLIDVVA